MKAIDGASVVRVRRAPLRVAFRAASAPARVSFSVPRAVGNAVVRNRARRRLRETLRELVREGAVTLSDGEYRLGTAASLEETSPAELRTTLLELMGGLERR